MVINEVLKYDAVHDKNIYLFILNAMLAEALWKAVHNGCRK